MTQRLQFVLVACLLGSFAQSQDLGALARKEKERRAKIAKPVKVLTEEDGKAAATAGSVTVITGVVSVQEAAVAVDASEQSKATWKARADAARERIKSAQAAITATEKEMETVRNDMAPLDAADAQDPMRLQKREAKIAELGKQADAQRVALIAARKAFSDLEDEARRSGIPAGWLR